MCDERERLLDYLYEACDTDERRRVDVHLADCRECRDEIAGLRAVRQDLLAWDVPEHGSVWKPFAQSRSTPWWREVPVWALATAASVMFLLGLAGGLVSRQLGPSPVAAAVVPPALEITPRLDPPAVPTAAQMAEIEQRILGVVRAQLDRRIQPVAAHAQRVNTANSEEELLRQVQQMLAASELRQKQALMNVLQDADKSFLRIATFNNFRNRDLTERIQYVVQQAQQQGGGQ